jgi:DNA-binding CsgD family transcriptional regulator
MEPGVYAIDDDGLTITARELEILLLAASGRSAKEIAKALDLSVRTVERHLENCRHKFRARNRPQMIARALANGTLSKVPPTS